MAKLPYKRRRILIDDAQYRLLAFNLIYFFSILLVIAATLFVPLMLQMESGTLSMVQKEQVANHLLSLHTRLWPALLVLFVLLAIHSIFVSHRIWGALYRFRTVFEAVAEGNLSVRTTIRQNDYLWKEADLINEMITTLSDRIKNIEDQHRKLREVWAELKKASDSASAKEVNHHIQSLGAQMEKLKVYLDQFKVAKSNAKGPATITRS